MNSRRNYPEIAVAISGFLRPEILFHNVQNCIDLLPFSKIYISIDKYAGENRYLKNRNDQTIKEAKRFGNQVELTTIPKINFGIKKTVGNLINLGLKQNQYVVFLEDDVYLKPEFVDEIPKIMTIMESRPEIAFASLYNVYPHFGKRKDWLSTKWPRMWGLFFRKQNYSSFLSKTEEGSNRDFRLFVQNKNSYIQREFNEIWNWKFTAAKESIHSFDTSLMGRLWKSRFEVLTPSNSLTEDKGGGVDSFSARTIEHFEPHAIRTRRTRGLDFCEFCEKFRYLEFGSRRHRFLASFSKWQYLSTPGNLFDDLID